MRLMLVLVMLAGAATVARAEDQSYLDDKAKKKVIEQIEKTYGPCPEIRDVKYIGAEERGNVLRVFCAEVGGPVIENATFRLIVGPRGTARLFRWTE